MITTRNLKNMKISVVTTFHQAGYEKYGRHMIKTFLKNWPTDVTLYVYAEDCIVTETADNLLVVDLHKASPELCAFKEKWKNVPKANGDISAESIGKKRPDSKKAFKWHAVRFAHKVYSIFACARECDSELLIWMDADTVCHSPISTKQLTELIPSAADLCYLGRTGKYSECGLYSMNLKSLEITKFLKEFQRVYDDAENGIFLLGEWHDSYVFDEVRGRFPCLVQHNWSQHLTDLRAHSTTSVGEGHPLINCEWGEYLDHLKGDRKSQGHSNLKDLKVKHKSNYWSTT
jgi:hypothetical protein